jgi:hypothetical protein
LDIRKAIDESFSEINESNNDNNSSLIKKDLIMKIVDTFLSNQDSKDDKALTNLIISELEKLSKVSDD